MNTDLITDCLALLNIAKYKEEILNQKKEETIVELRKLINKETLKAYINRTYGSELAFCKDKGMSQQICNYWCKKKWQEMTLTTRNKILKYLGLDEGSEFL